MKKTANNNECKRGYISEGRILVFIAVSVILMVVAGVCGLHKKERESRELQKPIREQCESSPETIAKFIETNESYRIEFKDDLVFIENDVNKETYDLLQKQEHP